MEDSNARRVGGGEIMPTPVFDNDEFKRIRDLPRRDHDWSPERTRQAIELISGAFGKGTGKKVRAIQARAVCEYADTGTLVAEVGAGFGKALMSMLVARVAVQRFGKQRILLVVPAKLREQTIDVHADWAKHFSIPPLIGAEAAWNGGAVIRLLSYESLSVVSKATFLEQWRPDVIICDEAHFLARMKSARTKRMFRYVRSARKAGEDIHFIPLSGTMRRKSLRECAHIYAAALQDMSPLPNDYPTLESWSFCLDEGVDEFLRYDPGALLDLCEEDEKKDLQGWRKAVRRRLISTPGVIATSEAAVDIPLVLQVRRLQVPDAVLQALAEVRQGLLPTGDEADSPIAIWQAARQLATGFSYRWVPAGPEDWLEARRNWNTFVREVLEHPPRGMTLDSPLQVWQAVDAGKFGHVPEQAAWRAIRDTFKPNPVPHWVSDFMVKDAEGWALETGGIVWVNHTSALEKDGCQDDVEIGKGFTKIPFFGAGDERIATYKGPCAASIRAHGTGRNLQQWSRALITCLPSSGSTLEQLLARHHRVGQEADLVHVEFYAHTPEMVDALETAQRDAAYAEGLSGQPQRVLSSNILDETGHRLDIGSYRVTMGWG